MIPERLSLAAIVGLTLPAGCRPAESSHLEAVADVKQLMTAIVEPAAEVYWDAVGTIIDSSGTHEVAPATTEEWAEVWRAAMQVAESGNLLMVNGRARDREEWMALSRELVAVGRKAVAAAESRDPQAVFQVGGEIYEACTACHARYALETLRPSDPRQSK